MMEKRWFDGGWFLSQSLNCWCYLKPGYYEPGVMHQPEDFLHQITAQEIESLIRKLDEAGWIKPRLDERLRREDLKITHRVIDLLDKSLSVGAMK